MYQYYKGEQFFYGSNEHVSLAATYVPYLPNTGFEPQDGMVLAFALVALIAVAIVAYPYVRKAFTIVRG